MNQFDKGDAPLVTVTVRNAAGALVSPTDHQWKTLSPSGVLVTYEDDNAAVSEVSTGVFTLQMPALNEEGKWQVRFVGTEGALVAVEQTFTVRRTNF